MLLFFLFFFMQESKDVFLSSFSLILFLLVNGMDMISELEMMECLYR